MPPAKHKAAYNRLQQVLMPATRTGEGVNRESFDHSGLYRRRAYGEKRDYTDKYVSPEMTWIQVIFHGEKN
jgi:Zn-dependent membrane protease YugP